MSQTPSLASLKCGLLGLTILLCALSACGRKGPPVVPRPVTPAAVGMIRAEPRDRAILVSWARPSRNEDRTPLTDLQEFRLYRAMGPAAAQAAGGQPSFSLLKTVRAERPENAAVQGDLYAYLDDGGGSGLMPGLRYTYRVQAVNRRGIAGPPSVAVFVDFLPAPPPPVNLTTSAGDGIVDLTWQAPPIAGPAETGPVRGYNVYRGERPGTHGPEPLNGRLLSGTQFRDAAVKNEATYYYVVRSVGTERPPWRESPDSNEAAATPMDFTPPAPPRGLAAVPVAGAIALSWEPNAEPDLLGYLVYRRELPAVTPIRLTPTPILGTTFTDRTAQPGARYVYTVSAVDRSPNRNESAPSDEVSVAHP